jgi:gluconate kinase
MKSTLLESQFEILEEPPDAIVVDIKARPEKIASLIVKELK